MIFRLRCPDDEAGKREYLRTKGKGWKHNGCYLNTPTTWTSEYYEEMILPNVLSYCALKGISYVYKKEEKEEKRERKKRESRNIFNIVLID